MNFYNSFFYNPDTRNVYETHACLFIFLSNVSNVGILDEGGYYVTGDGYYMNKAITIENCIFASENCPHVFIEYNNKAQLMTFKNCIFVTKEDKVVANNQPTFTNCARFTSDSTEGQDIITTLRRVVNKEVTYDTVSTELFTKYLN